MCALAGLGWLAGCLCRAAAMRLWFLVQASLSSSSLCLYCTMEHERARSADECVCVSDRAGTANRDGGSGSVVAAALLTAAAIRCGIEESLGQQAVVCMSMNVGGS